MPPQPSPTWLPQSVSLHWVFGIQTVVDVVDVVVVVLVVLVEVVVGDGFFNDGTHSSRRWIRSGLAGPNWLFVNVCTVPKAEFFVL